jgi:hypothetical protein
MKGITALGFLTAAVLSALALSGCVTEEIGPTNFQTTAYVERNAPSADEDQSRTNATQPSAPDDSDSSGDESHH